MELGTKIGEIKLADVLDNSYIDKISQLLKENGFNHSNEEFVYENNKLVSFNIYGCSLKEKHSIFSILGNLKEIYRIAAIQGEL